MGPRVRDPVGAGGLQLRSAGDQRDRMSGAVQLGGERDADRARADDHVPRQRRLRAARRSRSRAARGPSRSRSSHSTIVAATVRWLWLLSTSWRASAIPTSSASGADANASRTASSGVIGSSRPCSPRIGRSIALSVACVEPGLRHRPIERAGRDQRIRQPAAVRRAGRARVELVIPRSGHEIRVLGERQAGEDQPVGLELPGRDQRRREQRAGVGAGEHDRPSLRRAVDRSGRRSGRGRRRRRPSGRRRRGRGRRRPRVGCRTAGRPRRARLGRGRATSVPRGSGPPRVPGTRAARRR